MGALHIPKLRVCMRIVESVVSVIIAGRVGMTKTRMMYTIMHVVLRGIGTIIQRANLFVVLVAHIEPAHVI